MIVAADQELALSIMKAYAGVAKNGTVKKCAFLTCQGLQRMRLKIKQKTRVGAK